MLQVLFEKDGVFILTTVAKADEDALVSGEIFLFEKVSGSLDIDEKIKHYRTESNIASECVFIHFINIWLIR